MQYIYITFILLYNISQWCPYKSIDPPLCSHFHRKFFVVIFVVIPFFLLLHFISG